MLHSLLYAILYQYSRISNDTISCDLGNKHISKSMYNYISDSILFAYIY